MKFEAKKICFLCYRNFPDTNFEHYSRFTSDYGFDVSVISFLKKGQKKFEIKNNRKIFRIPLIETKNSRKKHLKFLQDAIQILKVNHFDIIQIHHTCSYFLLIKLSIRKKAKFIFHITSYPISQNKIERNRKMLSNFIQSLFLDKIIIQSTELKEKLFGFKNLKKAEIVPVGFNGKIFYKIDNETRNNIRKILNIESDNKVLVYCGAISKYRNLEVLIDAFLNVNKIIPRSKLLMIGDGDNLELLKKLVKKNGIEKDTIFTGKIDHENVAQYLGAADIGISFVPINENYNYNPPLKTFEYLACGLPTIATKTLSNNKIIKNNTNGILVNDTSDDIAYSIIKLINNKKKIEVLRENSRNSIKNYDFKKITKQKLIPIYNSLLN